MSTRLHYVYWLYVGDECVYVGRSVVPQSRKRRFELTHSLTTRMEVREFDSLSEAQKAEIEEITRLTPKFNKRVASSPSRLGFRNSSEHNAAISAALKGRALTDDHKSKLWENRSRKPEDNSFYGKRHSEETKEVIRAKTAEQFSDPEKRNRHREACVAAIERRRAAGLPLGRASKGVRG